MSLAIIRSQSGSEFGNLSPQVSENRNTFSTSRTESNMRINSKTKSQLNDIELEKNVSLNKKIFTLCTILILKVIIPQIRAYCGNNLQLSNN